MPSNTLIVLVNIISILYIISTTFRIFFRLLDPTISAIGRTITLFYIFPRSSYYKSPIHTSRQILHVFKNHSSFITKTPTSFSPPHSKTNPPEKLSHGLRSSITPGNPPKIFPNFFFPFPQPSLHKNIYISAQHIYI